MEDPVTGTPVPDGPVAEGPYRLPPVDEVAIRPVLERHARNWPDEVFMTFSDGTTWTREQGVRQAYGAAHALRAAGVRQGDRVAIMLGNGPDFFRAWWGVSFLGATMVPVNTAYRGTLLGHLLRLAAPRHIVADTAGFAAVDALQDASVVPPVRLSPADLGSESGRAPELERPITIRDAAALVMTSGTTGPSKLAVNSHLHLFLGGSWFTHERSRGREDVFLVDLPLFHGAALWLGTAALVSGVRLAVRPAPDLKNYWEVLRDSGATMAILLSAMVPILLGQPPRAVEREHTLRTMITNPPPPDIAAFMDRFALPEAWTGYGMTEVPAPLTYVAEDEMRPGYCGRQRRGFECRLVDDDDIEVPEGSPGELIVRADQPWMIAHEYVDNPEATARVWRNGWFHTGDMMRREGEQYFFVDRAKDAMRRRGENVSSVELEAEIRTHADVAEVACVPYRPEGTVEDEVKAWIVPAPDSQVDFPELLRYCVDRMPYFMVPRYFELIEDLPKTPSLRVKKFELRSRGNGSATWDREEHGLRVTRSGIRETEPA
jgi:crotonobetaine/carnitine-CoA ligase